MKAAIYHDIRNVSVEEIPDPAPGENDAVVQVALCGLCGSDMTAWKSGGMFVGIDKDAEFGHEFCGTISQVGSNVEGIEVGDRVIVRPDKAKRELGWEAQYGIEEMCRDSWNWQKNNPNGYRA